MLARAYPAYTAASNAAFMADKELTDAEVAAALEEDAAATLDETFPDDVLQGTPLGNLYKDRAEIEGPVHYPKPTSSNVAENADNLVLRAKSRRDRRTLRVL